MGCKVEGSRVGLVSPEEKACFCKVTNLSPLLCTYLDSSEMVNHVSVCCCLSCTCLVYCIFYTGL